MVCLQRWSTTGAACWRAVLVGLMGFGLVFANLPTHAAERNMRVEFRQLGAQAQAGSYSAGTDSSPLWEPQMLLVRSGEKAVLRIHDSVPMQWVQSVNSQNTATTVATAANGPTPGASASSTGNSSGVTQALAWFDAGQSLAVTATWMSGRAMATLKIEVERAAVDPYSGATLPRQERANLSTTVVVPLAEWVTIGATGGDSGGADSEGGSSYRSDATAHRSRTLQVRVMVP